MTTHECIVQTIKLSEVDPFHQLLSQLNSSSFQCDLPLSLSFVVAHACGESVKVWTKNDKEHLSLTVLQFPLKYPYVTCGYCTSVGELLSVSTTDSTLTCRRECYWLGVVGKHHGKLA